MAFGKKRKKSHGHAAADSVFMQNSIKTLVANIRFASIDNPLKSIVVTSSIPNEGKTTVSIQLARALAQAGQNVLIVECDMRRRSLGGSLDAHPAHGIYSVMSGETPLMDALVQTSTANLYFLDAEPHIPNPADLYASKRFHQLVHDLNRAFDYVVYDTPPLSTFVDAAVIGSVADATLLVVRQDYAKRPDLVASYDQLQKAGANVVGAVLNFCESERSEYYYSYYNRDGKRVRTRDAAEPAPMPEPKPIPKAAPAHRSVPSIPAAQDSQFAPSSTNRSSSSSSGASGAQAQSDNSAGRPDETMAFLAKGGYAPSSTGPVQVPATSYDLDE